MDSLQLFTSVLSVVSVPMLGGVAWLLKLGGAPIRSEAQACTLADQLLPGFVAERAVLAPAGDAAVLFGQQGVALMRRNGDRAVARKLPHPVRLARRDATLRIETGEYFFGAFRITLADAVQAQRLAVELEGC